MGEAKRKLEKHKEMLLSGIMEQPPPAADPQPGENSLVFNEREHFPWRRATWLRH